MDKPIQHGMHSSYTHRKCRCELCGAAMRAYQIEYRAKNHDRVLARDRAYHADHREARRAYEATPERLARQRANTRRRYPGIRQKKIARDAVWRAAHPEQRLLAHARRRALKAAADTRLITDRDWRRLVNRYGGKCAYCGTDGSLTRDHIVPLVRGGRHSIGNLLPVCGSCNSSKNASLLSEWRYRNRRGAAA